MGGGVGFGVSQQSASTRSRVRGSRGWGGCDRSVAGVWMVGAPPLAEGMDTRLILSALPKRCAKRETCFPCFDHNLVPLSLVAIHCGCGVLVLVSLGWSSDALTSRSLAQR